MPYIPRVQIKPKAPIIIQKSIEEKTGKIAPILVQASKTNQTYVTLYMNGKSYHQKADSITGIATIVPDQPITGRMMVKEKSLGNAAKEAVKVYLKHVDDQTTKYLFSDGQQESESLDSEFSNYFYATNPDPVKEVARKAIGSLAYLNNKQKEAGIEENYPNTQAAAIQEKYTALNTKMGELDTAVQKKSTVTAHIKYQEATADKKQAYDAALEAAKKRNTHKSGWSTGDALVGLGKIAITIGDLTPRPQIPRPSTDIEKEPDKEIPSSVPHKEGGKEDSKNTMEVASPAQESQAGKPKSLPKTGAEAEMISLGVCLLVGGLSVIFNPFKRNKK